MSWTSHVSISRTYIQFQVQSNSFSIHIMHIISHPVLRFPGNETWSDQIAQVSAAGDRRLVACEYKTHTANKFDEIPTAISRIPDYHYGLVWATVNYNKYMFPWFSSCASKRIGHELMGNFDPSKMLAVRAQTPPSCWTMLNIWRKDEKSRPNSNPWVNTTKIAVSTWHLSKRANSQSRAHL
jgi:hypothetical protein